MSEEPIDIRQLARAIRFALVAFIVAHSYYDIRASLSIPQFQRIFIDMLGARPLPGLTVFVVQMQIVSLGISLMVPAVSIATLFWRKLVPSFYLLGCLAFVGVVQLVVLYHALMAPLVEIIKSLGANPGP